MNIHNELCEEYADEISFPRFILIRFFRDADCVSSFCSHPSLCLLLRESSEFFFRFERKTPEELMLDRRISEAQVEESLTRIRHTNTNVSARTHACQG